VKRGALISLYTSRDAETVTVKLTYKPLSNGPVADEATISVVRVTFSKSLIDGAQVQVDSIIQVELDDLQVDSIM